MFDRGIGSWPGRRARSSSARVAFTEGQVHWTYGEVEADSFRLALALREMGVVKGDRVAYLGLNSVDLLQVLFAAAKLGAVFVPLNTRLAPLEVEYILGDCTPKVLVWGPQFEELLGHVDTVRLGVGRIAVHDDGPAPRLVDLRSGRPDAVPCALEEVGLADLFMIQYTSGTSGHPKGVMLTHGNITWNTMNCVVDGSLTADSVTVVMAPLFHSAALNMVTLPVFIKGGRCLIEQAFDAGRALELFESERVTFFFGVAAMYVAMMQHPRWDETDLSSVVEMSTGGQGMPEPMLRRLADRGLKMVNGYGLTETSPGLTVLTHRDAFRKLGSVGTAHFFTDVQVVDGEGTPLPAGEPGEIVAAGPNVSSGYFNNPSATRDTISEEGWLRTGDLGRYDEDGCLTIVDRVKDMIISGGENIYPAEIESVVYDHPAVAEAAVIGVPDERWGEVGHAVVSLQPGAELTADALLEFLGARIARYKIPRHVTFVDQMPHTASGKVLKRGLREIVMSGT